MVTSCLFSAILLTLSMDDKALQDRLIQSHRAARESISGLHCTIIQQASEASSPLQLQGSFWKTAKGYRLSISRPPTSRFQESKSDTIYLNGVALQLITRRRANIEETVLVKYIKRSYQDFGNPYFFGLLSFIAPDEIGPFTLEELFDNRSLTVNSIRSDRSSGHEMIELKLSHKSGYFLITFDESVNYLVKRAIYSINNDKVKSIHTVDKFAEVTKGVYFPSDVILKNEVDGIVRETVATSIKVVTVNKAIDQEFMQILIPHGTLCQDRIRNEFYRVDTKGNRIGDLLTASGKSVSTPTESKNETVPDHTVESTHGFKGQSSEEPRTWTVWIFGGSFLLLLTASTMYAVRRYNMR